MAIKFVLKPIFSPTAIASSVVPVFEHSSLNLRKFLLENSISFSSPNQEIVVDVFNSKDGKPTIAVIDEGTGFIEKDTNKIFNRFYSNRPKNFGEHSGLGLNIVKNLVELHNGQIIAENNRTHTLV